MTGETKQFIANVRSEFRRLVLNRVQSANSTDTAEQFINDIVDRIEQFEAYLKATDLPVEHQVPPLGVATGDNNPVADRFS